MYAELHCHTNYSFKEGASSVDEILSQAKKLGYRAIAITDHDNLCGAMQFAQVARNLEIQSIIGAEITLQGNKHITLLAETRQGYSNLCRLISYSHISSHSRKPELDWKYLNKHSNGLILLTGCHKGQIPNLLMKGKVREAELQAKEYLECLGPGNVFIELQQNLVHGDTYRNRLLIALADRMDIPLVATNNVHYHIPDRHRLQDALVAIHHNKSLEEVHLERRPNSQFYLKSPKEMARLFYNCPKAIENTILISERCTFDLSRDLGYQFPDHPVPAGHSPDTYLAELCYKAAKRRYGHLTNPIQERLNKEFRLIKKHQLAGFFLIYHEIIQMARQVMIDLGLSKPEIPLEERPPGRGRGSSVAMLVGYLIGLSHIDPMKFNLSIERFLHEDMNSVPDIDLDFPRNIREELIKRVHKKWGWDHAALTCTINTYKMKSAIHDLGKALDLPLHDINKLAKKVDSHNACNLKEEVHRLPEFKNRIHSPVWRDLIDLSSQINGFPKNIAQHPGGMIISSSPITEMVPVQHARIKDRYICHWDKDSISDAGFIKIDFLALGVLSQMQDALKLIEKRTGQYIDMSRIAFEDKAVYEMLHKADTIGIFQVESAAQMQTIVRIKPKNLTEMAYEVSAVRPGIGANDGVTQFIKRHSLGEIWDYDHPLEKHALERTLGVILFQDQVNQLAVDVAGYSPRAAEQLRRIFLRKTNKAMLEDSWERFREGAMQKGVPNAIAKKIFEKFNGGYMFPEAHAFAFGCTAYHMAWLKHYYPLEFFVAIFNNQPMGFYTLETLKEDAKKHGVAILNPDINCSQEKSVVKPHLSNFSSYPGNNTDPYSSNDSGNSRTSNNSTEWLHYVSAQHTKNYSQRKTNQQYLKDNSLLLGLLNVKRLGKTGAMAIIQERDNHGLYLSLKDFMRRIQLDREALDNLLMAGVFDSLNPNRRSAMWEVGLLYNSTRKQIPLPLPVDQDIVDLPKMSSWETMTNEYYTMGIYPKAHLMTRIRTHLPRHTITSQEVLKTKGGQKVTVAGLVIRRQRPKNKAVFITLEDEFGHIPIILWPNIYEHYRLILKKPVLLVRGILSRRNGTINIILKNVQSIETPFETPKSKNWI